MLETLRGVVNLVLVGNKDIMPGKLTVEKVRQRFEVIGYTLLENEIIAPKQKVRIVCDQGHESSLRLDSFAHGVLCQVCSKNAKNVELKAKRDAAKVEAQEQFAQHGYKVDLTEYIDVNTMLPYVCPKNHLGRVTFKSFKLGVRCKRCYADRLRLDFDYIKSVFENEGYALLSDAYVTATSPLVCLCPKGHEQKTTWSMFKKGYRCQQCRVKNRRLELFNQAKELFESEGYTLLSNVYVSIKTPLKYKCDKGHQASVSFDNFKRGVRCRLCVIEARRGSESYKRVVPGYYAWRRHVCTRDFYKCRKCSSKKDIVAHHIESFAYSPDLRVEPSNGITLCYFCHKAFHNTYGYHKNNRNQLIEFLGFDP